MIVHNHSGPSPDYNFELPGAMGVFLVEFAWWAARPLWHLIFGGVFEKFPKLKYCLTEVSEFWVPSMLEMMDVRASVKHTSGKLGDFRSNLTLKPSEYFARQVYGCFWFEQEGLRGALEQYPDNILWETDFPHPTCQHPSPVHDCSQHPAAYVEKAFSGVSDDIASKVLHDTAAELWAARW